MAEMFLKDKSVFEKDEKDINIILQICHQMWARGSTFPLRFPYHVGKHSFGCQEAAWIEVQELDPLVLPGKTQG